MWRVLGAGGVSLLGAVGGVSYYHHKEKENVLWTSEKPSHKFTALHQQFKHVPQREEQIAKLREGREYDLLVIGGGCVGSGVALDAVTRGLRVGLVEAEDFSSGTSSRSTKLIHGGVRYLEKAFKQFDYAAFTLVFEALHERARLLKNAPHLTQALPIMTPCYKLWEVPYYWAGMKMYDLLSGRQGLQWSHFLGRKESLKEFPMLAKEGLKGAILYYDGQMDDARVNLSLALTAGANGANIANHVEVVGLLKDQNEKVIGARVKDNMNGQEWNINAKVVVNATGPFVDSIRKMEDPTVEDIITPSSGVHVVLPDYYSPENTGLIVPKTKDGRVIFMLPWEGQTIAGTTDSSTQITRFPQPHEKEIQFILEALSDYLSVHVRRSDVRAAWSGIRPLAKDISKSSNAMDVADTANISRDHSITVGKGNVVTITGGKWTTYRLMAEDTVNKAIEVGNLKSAKGCSTYDMVLLGGENWEQALFTVIAQDCKRLKTSKTSNTNVLVHFPSDIAKHLSQAYGTRALRVAQIAHDGYGNRLSESHPYIEAEVVYAAQEEFAITAVDVIARRLRLAFLDAEASASSINRVVDILAETLNWNEGRKQKELAEAKRFLHIMTVGRLDEEQN